MGIHQEIYERLKDVAHRGELTYYSEIAPLAVLDMGIQADRTKMGEILGEISTHEHNHGRPMLSAIVVLAGIGYPGEGFYNLARFLGLHHGHDEFADLDFFVQEVKRVHSYWQGTNQPD